MTWELGPGQSARFGRGVPGCPVEIALPDPAVPRLAGEIRAAADHWQLSNFGTASYLVENPEGAGEYIRVAPRRIGAPIPFEFARVVLPAKGPGAGFQVFAPAHTYCEAGRSAERSGSDTVAAFSLDESATYFLVLVALCEPRLRDLSVAAIPTTPQVVERLRGHPDARELTGQAVSFHVDYLARNKLRIKPAGSGGQRLEWKRESVVSLALRFGLVREEHLALLPGPYSGLGGNPEPAPTVATVPTGAGR
ncbi:serine/threonine protein kinase [Streptomyces sp. H10-C2]|uniref:serine/threonine protein kinase n=1 Tax=unclassified Streptomyces TaxID=2593676 RepID=UPI0024BAA64B|nr:MULTISPECIES: serine/threonine protein kinase [unclassified Streptomyces]MDJ0344752.1 serine/threonine protein kinase [Streptomyces sp. PH10-H1]MDJ0371243.1 serine/threonine protein kinase [Streptomyces sp. H10-C2]